MAMMEDQTALPVVIKAEEASAQQHQQQEQQQQHHQYHQQQQHQQQQQLHSVFSPEALGAGTNVTMGHGGIVGGGDGNGGGMGVGGGGGGIKIEGSTGVDDHLLVGVHSAVNNHNNNMANGGGGGGDGGGGKPDGTITARSNDADNCSDLTDNNNETEEQAPKSFPQKLMDILTDETHTDIISWLPHGTGFQIHKKKTFAAEVLPRFFKASKFTSFTRKLNRWGFTRVPRGPETGAYFHKLFRRDKPELCMQMTSNSGNKYQANPMQQSLLPSMPGSAAAAAAAAAAGMMTPAGMPTAPMLHPAAFMNPAMIAAANLTPQQQQAMWQQQMQQMMMYQQQTMIQMQQQQMQQQQQMPQVPQMQQQQPQMPPMLTKGGVPNNNMMPSSNNNNNNNQKPNKKIGALDAATNAFVAAGLGQLNAAGTDDDGLMASIPPQGFVMDDPTKGISPEDGEEV